MKIVRVLEVSIEGYFLLCRIRDNESQLYYLYKCRCLGDKPSINGGIKYLKYCIKIEKTTINFLSSTQKEYIKRGCQY
jgi:hypothetical protein